MVNLLKTMMRQPSRNEDMPYKNPASVETGFFESIWMDQSNFSIDFWSWPMARSMEDLNFLL